MTEELETLRSVVTKLDEGKFTYILTGSMAMSFYSVPRMTRDSDIVIILHERDVDLFVRLFEEEFYVDKSMITDSLKNQMMFNIFNKKSFFKIDFILKENEEYEDMKFERRRKLKLNGFSVYVISIEDLIISKLNWAKDSHSEMQLNDLRELMKNEYDIKYVNKWVSKLNLKEIYNRV